jgi:hypothetical protein
MLQGACWPSGLSTFFVGCRLILILYLLLDPKLESISNILCPLDGAWCKFFHTLLKIYRMWPPQRHKRDGRHNAIIPSSDAAHTNFHLYTCIYYDFWTTFGYHSTPHSKTEDDWVLVFFGATYSPGNHRSQSQTTVIVVAFWPDQRLWYGCMFVRRLWGTRKIRGEASENIPNSFHELWIVQFRCPGYPASCNLEDKGMDGNMTGDLNLW